MKFEPQTLTNICGYSAKIITEDIPSSDLIVSDSANTGKKTIKAILESPICHKKFELIFEEKQQIGAETLFVCENDPNKGLEMWRILIDGKALQPAFIPNSAHRSDFEEYLDNRCFAIADQMVKWKNTPDPSHSLSDILKEVEDYTQSDSWRKFNRRHYMVALCNLDGNVEPPFIGFSGRYDTVKVKNIDLRNAFLQRLGGDGECKSNQYCKNVIGHCAEMHAANRCLNKWQRQSLDSLKFSIAYRCRTATPRSYCLNCITLFHTLTNA